ncbi:hypothetical protein N7449_003811 [Penicillium cf. viridicatum]|uniref:Cytochrome b561 domain-containing protein n=1 Tax=Penicillium cf. viridicatum TaxID=2972119 RepID=A0A9W9T4R0_9EURO|nr:hypothetical protein N7449_003811 [Penicillium cf. viridicatum]
MQFLFAPLIASLFISSAWAEPDVFCKSFGSNSNNDFCVSLSTYVDTAISKQDFIFTFKRTQYDAAGWTAFGMGNHMDGALMFILYGDPNSHLPPTLSIRSTTHHMAPAALAMGDQHQNGVHVGYLDVGWETSDRDQARVASASFTCYGCNAWFNADISASTPVLPMIWAVNTDQYLSTSNYSDNAPLFLHDRFGSFDLDMFKETTLAPPRLPDTIAYNIALSSFAGENPEHGNPPAAEDTSENPRYILSQRKLWVMHGLLMASSFYVFFPSGILFLRVSSAKSFIVHVSMQMLGSMTAFAGMTLGFLLSHGVHTWHQYIGLVIATTILLQGILGWMHHMKYERLKRKTKIGDVHVWLGWVVLILGWTNVAMGLRLSDYTVTLQGWFVVAACLEFGGLVFVAYRHRAGKSVGMPHIPVWSLLSRIKTVRWARHAPTNGASAPGSESLYTLTAEGEDQSSDSDEAMQENDLGKSERPRMSSQY